MLYTLADARTVCKQFVSSGSCNNTLIDARINEALERLAAEEPWESLRRIVRISVEGESFALPWNAGKLLWCDVNGTPARTLRQSHQFLDAGPGDPLWRSVARGYQDIEDLGDTWPIMYEIPTAFETDSVTVSGSTTDAAAHTAAHAAIVAAATAAAATVEGTAAHTTAHAAYVAAVTAHAAAHTDGTVDAVTVGEDGWSLCAVTKTAVTASKSITIHGVSDGEDVTETLAIHRWADGVEGQLRGTWTTSIPTSANLYSRLTRITLPDDLVDYVSLYAVDTATNYMYFLAKYHPSQTPLPQFRRYRIKHQHSSAEANVLAMIQLRHVPLSLATDILPVNSTQALKLMVISISHENAGALDEAIKYASMAIRVLTKNEEASTLTGGTPIVVDSLRRISMAHGVSRRVLL